MRQIMEKLLALQKLALDTKPLKLEHETEVLKWREKMPASILSHFDRLIARGKKGVAIARNGRPALRDHLRLPSGTMGALAYTNEVHLCDNCGRYLLSAGERAARPDRFAAADQSPRQITRQTNPAESGFACRLIPSSIPPL
jgi:Zn-ribbon protein, possibly nucleic acid-binding